MTGIAVTRPRAARDLLHGFAVRKPVWDVGALPRGATLTIGSGASREVVRVVRRRGDKVTVRRGQPRGLAKLERISLRLETLTAEERYMGDCRVARWFRLGIEAGWVRVRGYTRAELRDEWSRRFMPNGAPRAHMSNWVLGA